MALKKTTKKAQVRPPAPDEPVFIIAEIGKGFIQTKEERPVAEYIANATRLIDEAAAAGVDAVKFQTHEAEDEVLNTSFTSPHFKGAERYAWVTRNTKATPPEFWQKVKAHAKKRGVAFFSTPMSRRAAMRLNDIGVDLWKVGSGDIQDFVMLEYLIGTGKHIIFSTGMVSLAELDEVVAYLESRNADFSILYCVSQYPAPKESFNLATLELFKEKYPGVRIGFSDHSVGDDELTLAAVKLGAKVIEKHFSLSRDLWGSDHKVSMTPAEMKALVRKIRAGEFKNVDHAPYYGTKTRELEGAHNQFRPYFNKGLVAGRDLPKGATLTKDMIYAMRPIMLLRGALPANHFHKVVGKTLKRSLKKFDPITRDVLL